MHLLVIGGTGFLGSHLVPLAVDAGHEVTITSRSPARKPDPPGVSRHVWDTESPLVFDAPVDAVYNLAGANLFGHRWTESYKKKVHDSRVRTTRHVVDWIGRVDDKPRVLVNSSAVGYYGLPDKPSVSEDDPPGDDFLAKVCRDWEAEAMHAEAEGVRVVRMRTAIMLGEDGGALERLEPIFRLGAGGTIGNGRQPFPWVSVDDAARAMLEAATNEDMSGAYNLVAPAHDTNKAFTQALGDALHRPTVVPVPTFVLSAMYGEGAKVMTDGVYVEPDRLRKEGFDWRDPDLGTTFSHLYGR